MYEDRFYGDSGVIKIRVVDFSGVLEIHQMTWYLVMLINSTFKFI